MSLMEMSASEKDRLFNFSQEGDDHIDIALDAVFRSGLQKPFCLDLQLRERHQQALDVNAEACAKDHGDRSIHRVEMQFQTKIGIKTLAYKRQS